METGISNPLRTLDITPLWTLQMGAMPGVSSTFPTTTTVDSTLDGSSTACIVLQDSVTYVATVTSTGGTPTGNVIFSDAGGTLGTSALSSGVATITISTQPLGPDTVTAAYQGDGTFAISSGTVSVNIVNSGDTCGGIVRWPDGPLQIDPGLIAWWHANIDPAGVTGSGSCPKTTTDPTAPLYGYTVPPFGSNSVREIGGGFRVVLISHGAGISATWDLFPSSDPRGTYLQSGPPIVIPGPYGAGSTITVT